MTDNKCEILKELYLLSIIDCLTQDIDWWIAKTCLMTPEASQLDVNFSTPTAIMFMPYPQMYLK